MIDFGSILTAAQQLPEQDRIRLIDALWDTAPPESNAPFSNEWANEIENRVAQLDAGTASTIEWSQIRNEALGRIGHGKTV